MWGSGDRGKPQAGGGRLCNVIQRLLEKKSWKIENIRSVRTLTPWEHLDVGVPKPSVSVSSVSPANALFDLSQFSVNFCHVSPEG